MLIGAGIGFGIAFVYGLIDQHEGKPEDQDTGKRFLFFAAAGALVGFFYTHSLF